MSWLGYTEGVINSQAGRIMVAFLITTAGSIAYFYYATPPTLVPSLNAALPWFIFPNPLGSLYYSTLYSIPLGFITIIPIIIIARKEGTQG